MSKLIILSIVLMSVAVPTWLSTSPRPKVAIRKAQWLVVGFVVVWAYLCPHWYPDLAPLK